MKQGSKQGGTVPERRKMEKLFVGVDVSKRELEAAAAVDGKEVTARRTVKNNETGWNLLYEWALKHARKLGFKEVHYCFESTGGYSGELLEYLQDKPDAIVSMVNPAQIKSFAQSILLRTKTDKVDAGLIARFAFTMKPVPNEKISVAFKELRALVRHLDHLVRRRADEKSRLDKITIKKVRKSTQSLIAHFDKQIEDLENEIKKHLDDHPDLKGKVELLKSIPGISDTSARIILCEMLRVLDPRAQTAHAGLAPKQRQSGTSVRGKTMLCKTGNSRLRKSLYFPALSAVRSNPLVAAFYEKLIARGKPKMVALAACMRKLLVIAVGVLRNGVPFDSGWNRVKTV